MSGVLALGQAAAASRQTQLLPLVRGRRAAPRAPSRGQQDMRGKPTLRHIRPRFSTACCTSRGGIRRRRRQQRRCFRARGFHATAGGRGGGSGEGVGGGVGGVEVHGEVSSPLPPRLVVPVRAFAETFERV